MHKTLKTAIITWNSFYNYGTCLQAYALQQYIRSLGYDNYIIDDSSIVYDNDKTTKSNLILLKWRQRWIKLWQSFHANYRAFYKYQRVLCPKINHFKSTILDVDYDINSVLNDFSDYDVYICGSDQIWNPDVLNYRNGTFYYADFTKKEKISYAPSFGKYAIPLNVNKRIATLLNPFKALSVREEAGRKILSGLTQKQIELVVDPTLLLARKEWESLISSNIKSKEKYVLAYILTPNHRSYKIARDYAHSQGLRLYLFMLNIEDYGQADMLISGGPFDFLHYIRDAEMVFTDSYHGTIFSTIFETPFYTFKRFSDDSPINQNSRIDTLLCIMGAEDRLIDDSRQSLPQKLSPDFLEYKKRLEPHIARSKEFLIKNLADIEQQG